MPTDSAAGLDAGAFCCASVVTASAMVNAISSAWNHFISSSSGYSGLRNVRIASRNASPKSAAFFAPTP